MAMIMRRQDLSRVAANWRAARCPLIGAAVGFVLWTALILLLLWWGSAAPGRVCWPSAVGVECVAGGR